MKKQKMGWFAVNVYGIMMILPLVMIKLFIFYKCYDILGLFKNDILFKNLNIYIIALIYFISFLASTYVHEWLHYITLKQYKKDGIESMKITLLKGYAAPAVVYTGKISVAHFIVVSLMPYWILGMGLFIVALLTQNILLLFISITQTAGAAGDFYMTVHFLSKYKLNSYVVSEKGGKFGEYSIIN
jgi:hypothetical protein